MKQERPNRSAKIQASELAKIPFIDSQKIGSRVISNLTFFNDGKWDMWMPTPEGLHWLQGRPAEADYFAKHPERDDDIYVGFLNFMVQRACWADALDPIAGLQCDIHNLGASLAKIELFYRQSTDLSKEVRRFVSTEIEYIFGVCRSFFDLLQRAILRIWKRVKLLDEKLVKKNLPESFRKMVMQDKKRMSAEEIAEKWHLPLTLAEYYFKQGGFFELLRSWRDEVAHHGRDLNFLFVTERGFAVSADTEPFCSFGVWKEEHMQNNRLASLRPALAHVVTETFRACEEFTDIIQRIVEFPPEIVPNFKLYLRGFHNKQLLSMRGCIEECLWWDEEPSLSHINSYTEPLRAAGPE